MMRLLVVEYALATHPYGSLRIRSTIERRNREGALARLERRNLLLARHPLRAADAGRLAAAMLVQEQLSSPLTFVCLDQRLSIAAELEGLHVMP